MKRHIPNALTAMNLFCGCVAVVLLFRGRQEAAAWLVFLAAVFDLLDGMVARWLKVSSPMGKELDSLADMVTFGVVPGIVLFKLLKHSDLEVWVTDSSLRSLVQFVPFSVTVFSALRLARFNIDEGQKVGFLGLPTPANTLWIISLPLILIHDPGEWDFLLTSAPLIVSLSVVSCWLLVSGIPLFSFKGIGLGFRKDPYPLLLLVFAAGLLSWISFAAFPLIVAFYLLLSLVRNYFSTTNGK
ncbi:MAG: hypothetical protein RL213_298 [Bacteroidota bacterium]|jgi:CDP-diacylglycerol--serine O-phosphatidyltransferase